MSGLWFGGLHAFNMKPRVQKCVERQTDLYQLMTVFPAWLYGGRPTYEQLEHFVCQAEAEGYSFVGVIALFSFGFIPASLDAIMKELASSWQPLGEKEAHEQP